MKSLFSGCDGGVTAFLAQIVAFLSGFTRVIQFFYPGIVFQARGKEITTGEKPISRRFMTLSATFDSKGNETEMC